ncbi:EXOCYST COMPLEX PROTEIN EXO70 [Salix koriyanagi]|uniref:Exocyst subunit Exo70 family protein n=1 Tax=Salix koriyanagi TaxID=2511006 RepID=A0A9Q0P5E9_9ROSI|nr:EXOCYST COMPLEX PROTEIN EXO70 [Salix koriyanagi]
MQLLNFAKVVAIRRRSLEKLFQILDMYDALSSVFPDLEAMVMDEFGCTEAKRVLAGLGMVTKGTFMDETLNSLLENNNDDELNGLQSDDNERLQLELESYSKEIVGFVIDFGV